LTGDNVTATKDLDLSGLAGGTVVTLRDGILAGASASIAGGLGGSFHSGPVAGDLSIGSVRGFVQLGPITGSATVLAGVSGRIDLGAATVDPMAGATNEELTVMGGIGANATITSHQDVTLHVGKNFFGFLNVTGTVDLDIGGSLLNGSINSGDDLTLSVTGPVASSAVVSGQGILAGSKLLAGATSSEFLGGNGLSLDITGSVSNSRFSGGRADLTVGISGSVMHGQFLDAGDAAVTVGFSLRNSSVLSDGRLDLKVGRLPNMATPGVGDLVSSTIASKATTATVAVGGKTSASQFLAGTDRDLRRHDGGECPQRWQ
jgi:hypothetical protein